MSRVRAHVGPSTGNAIGPDSNYLKELLTSRRRQKASLHTFAMACKTNEFLQITAAIKDVVSIFYCAVAKFSAAFFPAKINPKSSTILQNF